jgi:ESS family glutamate:Na+ symporter
MKYSTEQFFVSLLILLGFLFISYLLKRTVLKSIIMPPSLIAGFLALLIGPGAFGPGISNLLQPLITLPDGLIPQWMVSIWKQMPAYWITVVFAGLFLGKEIPGIAMVWKQSMPNLLYGYILAIGQYVIGLALAILLIRPLFDGNVLSGALIAIGFQGGHGTVAGLQSTFANLGFDDGFDLGLGIATIGLLSAIIFGATMSNIARPGKEEMKMDDFEPPSTKDEASLPFQLALLGLTILLGWVLLTFLQWAENTLVNSDAFEIMAYVPLFPLAMIAGLIIQKIILRLSFQNHVSREKINNLTNLALDLLIISALGSLSLKVLADNWQILAILALGGIAYNALIYFTISKKVFGRSWRLQGLGELGQSMGTTAIGLILLHRAGKNSGRYIDSFSYKQPLYEPIVGGGLVTALSLPIMHQFGPYYFLGAAALLTCALVVASYFLKLN